MDADLRDRLVAVLTEGLGLSFTEARAYTALLSHNPVSRYELARLAHIPSPKIYGAVDRLFDKGLVVQSADEVPLVAPLEPERLLRRVRAQQESSLEGLAKVLAEVERSRDENLVRYTWNLTGTERAFEKANEIISRSKEALYLAGFGADLQALGRELEAASARGCVTMILTYGLSPLRVGQTVEHGDVDGVRLRTGGRWLALASDHQEVLVSYPLDGVADSVWMNSPVLAMIVAKYVQEHFYRERPINPVS